MSEFFDELITGLNEAVAIERGELNGRITVTDSIVQGFINEGRNEVIQKVLESKYVTPEQITDILNIPVNDVMKIAKNRAKSTKSLEYVVRPRVKAN